MQIHVHAAKGDIDELKDDLARRVSLESRDENGRTPLMVAVASPHADAETIRFLISSGADLNATVLEDDKVGASVLSIAVKETSLDKVIPLVAAGADVGHVDRNGYGILLDAMHRCTREPPEANLALLTFLIDAGAPLDVESEYGESAVSVASRRGDFAQLKLFLDRGADAARLAWSPLFYAVAFGSLERVKKLVDEGASLQEVDKWERTPFLVSVCAGRIDVAEYLLLRGSDLAAKGRCGNTALMYAIQRNDARMLKWLVSKGADVEEVDEFGGFPLAEAVGCDSAPCVTALLEAKARVDRRDSNDKSLMEGASSPEMVEVLYRAGLDLSDVGSAARRTLLGHGDHDRSKVAANDFSSFQNRRFGKQNPERMNNPFWESMVRSREGAYRGASVFENEVRIENPVWCFGRFGHSMTRLPDGRHVEIAGEHEDYYDSDFCIYNDVVVHRGDGSFDIFGYPEAVFPPTDFHTATYVAPYIYIVGSLGYPEHREPGVTPVYRLHSETWKIEKVVTTGAAPGWINRHRAKLVNANQIEISGGKVYVDEQTGLVDNDQAFLLDLADLCWRVAD